MQYVVVTPGDTIEEGGKVSLNNTPLEVRFNKIKGSQKSRIEIKYR